MNKNIQWSTKAIKQNLSDNRDKNAQTPMRMKMKRNSLKYRAISLVMAAFLLFLQSCAVSSDTGDGNTNIGRILATPKGGLFLLSDSLKDYTPLLNTWAGVFPPGNSLMSQDKFFVRYTLFVENQTGNELLSIDHIKLLSVKANLEKQGEDPIEVPVLTSVGDFPLVESKLPKQYILDIFLDATNFSSAWETLHLHDVEIEIQVQGGETKTLKLEDQLLPLSTTKTLNFSMQAQYSIATPDEMTCVENKLDAAEQLGETGDIAHSSQCNLTKITGGTIPVNTLGLLVRFKEGEYLRTFFPDLLNLDELWNMTVSGVNGTDVSFFIDSVRVAKRWVANLIDDPNNPGKPDKNAAPSFALVKFTSPVDSNTAPMVLRVAPKSQLFLDKGYPQTFLDTWIDDTNLFPEVTFAP